MGVCKLTEITGRRALEEVGRPVREVIEDGRVGSGKPQRGDPALRALWHLLQLLSHQPSARAEKTVNKDMVTREFLPNLGLLVAS